MCNDPKKASKNPDEWKKQPQGYMVHGSTLMEMDPITEMESLARVCGRGTEECGYYARAEEGLSTKSTVGFNIY